MGFILILILTVVEVIEAHSDVISSLVNHVGDRGYFLVKSVVQPRLVVLYMLLNCVQPILACLGLKH